MRIFCEAGQVNLNKKILYEAGNIHQIHPQQVSGRAEQVLPTVSLKIDKEAVTIGQSVQLTWDSQNAAAVLFLSGDLEVVGSNGSALVWPEQDTLYRIEARGGVETASAEVLVKVVVPDPELELEIEPKTVMDGQEVTITWKTRNARLVTIGEQGYEVLPLSGKMSFKPDMNTQFTPIVLTAENGDKKVRKSATIRVLDPEEERLRIEKEKASRSIPKEIDKTLSGLWQGLKEALKAGNAEKVASFYCLEARAKNLEIYKTLNDKLPQIGAEMGEIEFLEFQGDGAKYRTKRKETIEGKEYDISYYVYFVIDQDGQWRIYKF